MLKKQKIRVFDYFLQKQYLVDDFHSSMNYCGTSDGIAYPRNLLTESPVCNVPISISLLHSFKFIIKTTQTNERSGEEKESNRSIFIKEKRRSSEKVSY